ncbi:MAG: hypothetical protein ACRDRK_00620 [Pseudonocardia sp.]
MLLVQHTGCGLGTFTDDDFSEEIADEVGIRPLWRTLVAVPRLIDTWEPAAVLGAVPGSPNR